MKETTKIKTIQKTVGVITILLSILLFIVNYSMLAVAGILAGLYYTFTKQILFENEYKFIMRMTKGTRS